VFIKDAFAGELVSSIGDAIDHADDLASEGGYGAAALELGQALAVAGFVVARKLLFDEDVEP
jgi:O-methyltransferase involved in polyketide biosynthesis